MTWRKSREFFLVAVPSSRREYVCVWQEERGDRSYYDAALRSRGYELDWHVDAAQGAEMQAVMQEHGYQRILAMRHLTAHEAIRCRSLPNPRSMILVVDL